MQKKYLAIVQHYSAHNSYCNILGLKNVLCQNYGNNV